MVNCVWVDFAWVWRVIKVFFTDFLLLILLLRQHAVWLRTSRLLQVFPWIVCWAVLVMSTELVLINRVYFAAIRDICQWVRVGQLLERRLLIALVHLTLDSCGWRWKKRRADVVLREVDPFLRAKLLLLLSSFMFLFCFASNGLPRVKYVVLLSNSALLYKCLTIRQFQVKLILFCG